MVVVVQSLAQVKNMYDKLFEAVIGNCDTLVFLGGSEMETCKYISEKLGKTTIKTVSGNHSLGRNGNYSIGQNQTARDLMDPAEVAKMDNDMSIVIVRGVNPFYVPKYSLFEHPNFEMCGDASPDNMVGDEFLEKHYTCTNKDFLEEDEADDANEKAKEIMEEGTTPGVFGSEVTSSQMPLNNLQDMANAVNVEDVTEENVADKLTAKGDELPESEGPVVMQDVTDEMDAGMDPEDFGFEGSDFEDQDAFGDVPDMNIASPIDPTDYGMTGFSDDDESPESMGMTDESSKWLSM